MKRTFVFNNVSMSTAFRVYLPLLTQKIKGVNEYIMVLESNIRTFFPLLFVIRSFHLDLKHIKLCYFGWFLGVMIPWEDMGMHKLCVAYVIQSPDMINVKIRKINSVGTLCC